MEIKPRRLLAECNGYGRPISSRPVLQPTTVQNLNYPNSRTILHQQTEKDWLVYNRNGKSTAGPKENGDRRFLPLMNMSLYLDLKDFPGLQNLITEIKQLGGTIETFLTKDIKCVLTNRPKSSYQFLQKDGSSSMDNPSIPRTPSSNSTRSGIADSPMDRDSVGFRSSGSYKPVKSRTEALLEQALKSSTKGSCDVLQHCRNWNLKIMHIHSFLNWLKHAKAQIPKKPSPRRDFHKIKKPPVKSTGYNHKTKLVRQFMKFEDHERKYRPHYRQLSQWPTLNLTVSHRGSPFSVEVPAAGAGVIKSSARGRTVPVPATQSRTVQAKCVSDRSPAPPNQHQPAILGGNAKKEHVGATLGPRVNMATKTSSKPAGFRNKSGYCEMCSVRFEEMYKHIQTSKHRAYVKKADHFKELDKQIKMCDSVQEFVESLTRAALNRQASLQKEKADLARSDVSNKTDVALIMVSGSCLGLAGASKVAPTTSGVVQRLCPDGSPRIALASTVNSSLGRQDFPPGIDTSQFRGTKRSFSTTVDDKENGPLPSICSNTATHPNNERLEVTLESSRLIQSPPPKRRRPSEDSDTTGDTVSIKIECVPSSTSAMATSTVKAVRVLRSTVRRRFPSSNAALDMSSPIAQPKIRANGRQIRSSPGVGTTLGKRCRPVSRRSSSWPRRRIQTKTCDEELVGGDVNQDSGHMSDDCGRMEHELNSVFVVTTEHTCRSDTAVEKLNDTCGEKNLKGDGAIPMETAGDRVSSDDTHYPAADRNGNMNLPFQTLPAVRVSCDDSVSREILQLDSDHTMASDPDVGLVVEEDDADRDMSGPLDLSFKKSPIPLVSLSENYALNTVVHHEPAIVDPCRLTAGPDKVEVDIEAVLAEIMDGVVEPLEDIDEYSINMLHNVLATMDQNGILVGGSKEADTGMHAAANHHLEMEDLSENDIVAVGSNFGEDDDDDNEWDKSMESYLSKINSHRSESSVAKSGSSSSSSMLCSSTSMSGSTSTLSASSAMHSSIPILSSLSPSSTCEMAAEVSLSQSHSDQNSEESSCCSSQPHTLEMASSPSLTTPRVSEAFVLDANCESSVYGIVTPPCSQKTSTAVPRCSVVSASNGLKMQASQEADGDLRTAVLKPQRAIIPKHLFRRVHSESSEDSWTVQLIE